MLAFFFVEDFRRLQVQIDVAEAQTPAEPVNLQDYLERNTHFVIAQLQAVMNSLQEMFLSTETQFFSDNNEVWVTKVQIKLQQFLLTLISSCAEMCEETPDASKKIKPVFILSVVHICLFFEIRGLEQIQKTLDFILTSIGKKDSDEGSDSDSNISFNVIVQEIQRRYKNMAKTLLLRYISVHAANFEKMIKKTMETPNWRKQREPREVKLGTVLVVDAFFKIYVEMSTLFKILPVSKQVKQQQQQPRSPSPKPDPSGGTSLVKSMLRTPSLPNLPEKEKQLLQLQVQPSKHVRASSVIPALFLAAPQVNRSPLVVPPLPFFMKTVSFAFEKVKCKAPSVLFRVVQCIFKCYLERIRTKTINRHGCQQIQVDTEYMKFTFMKVLPEPRIEVFVKELQMEATSRTIDPIPMEESIIWRLCKEKAQERNIML